MKSNPPGLDHVVPDHVLLTDAACAIPVPSIHDRPINGQPRAMITAVAAIPNPAPVRCPNTACGQPTIQGTRVPSGIHAARGHELRAP